MKRIIKSFEENREHILGELPGKFHKDFELELQKLSEATEQEVGNEHEMIRNELRFHPQLDEKVVGEIDLEAHAPISPPSDEEQKQAMDSELERVKAEIGEI